MVIFLAGRKQKQGWVSDTKLTTTTFDDLFEEDPRHEDTVKHHRREDKTDIRKAWATNVGVMVRHFVSFSHMAPAISSPNHRKCTKYEPMQICTGGIFSSYHMIVQLRDADTMIEK